MPSYAPWRVPPADRSWGTIAPMSDPRRRVYLHIGAPKTGTTYLQDRLTANARSLARHGVHIPRASLRLRPDQSHFKAALDLLDQDWGGPPGHAKGMWPKLVRAMRGEGTYVVSHEVLAPARPEVVDRVMSDLSDHEVHIVYSARDLGRQLPAAWQESVKQGRAWGLKKFLERSLAGKTFFARSFDIPEVLGTWGAGLPADRLHVVTVPHTRGDALWLRYCEAFGIDPAWAPKDSVRANESLGPAEIRVLRELNRRLGFATRRSEPYDRLVLGMLGNDVLAGRGNGKVTVPPKRYDDVDARSEEMIAWLEQRGVDVIGDLDDLRPRRPDPGTPWRSPASVSDRAVLDAAIVALEEMTHEAARREPPRHTLTEFARKGMDRVRGKG